MDPSLEPSDGARQRLLHERRTPMLKARLTNRDGVDLADFKAVVGGMVQRAFSLVGWSIKEAAGHIGREPAQVSRWISGAERAQLDALFAVEALRMPLIQALAELAGEPVTVETSITLRKKVG